MSVAVTSSAKAVKVRGHQAEERARAAARIAAENRGRDIVLLDLRKQTSEFDFFVLVTGSSRRQLHAISDEISHAFKHQYGDPRLGCEGYDGSRWILIDFGDIVVHLFDDESRDFYALDQLWADAERIPYEAGESAAATKKPPR